MATKRPSRLDEIGEESRRRILDAAEELFAEKGVDRTSFVDIAERSGISRGSIPWHFKNKDGLILAVVERALSRDVALTRDSAEARTDTGSGDLDAVIESIKQWMRRPTAAMRYTVLAHALTVGGDVARSYREFNERRRKASRLIIEMNAPQALEAVEDPDGLAAVFNAAIIGLHVQWILDPSFDLDGGLDTLKSLIQRAQEAAERRGARKASRRRKEPASARKRP